MKKRNPRKVCWTKAFRKAAGKELAVDPVFEMEKRRHVPLKYDREIWKTTVDAMKSVEEMHKKRNVSFIHARMIKVKVLKKAMDVKEVEKNYSLIEFSNEAVKSKERQRPQIIHEEPEKMELA